MNPIKEYFQYQKEIRQSIYLCYLENKKEIDLLKEYDNYKFYNSLDDAKLLDYYFAIKKNKDTEELVLICSKLSTNEFYNLKDLIEEFRNNLDQN